MMQKEVLTCPGGEPIDMELPEGVNVAQATNSFCEAVCGENGSNCLLRKPKPAHPAPQSQ